MSKIVVIGSLNMDLVIKAPYMPSAGETIVGSDFETIPGGKGANQAAACARLGAETAMIGRVGNDAFGMTLVSSMNGFGVDTSGLIVDEYDKTGIAMIMVASGDNIIIISEGSNANVSIADIENASPLIEAAELILLQFEIPMGTIEYIIGKYKATKKIFLNPAPFKPIKDEFLDGLYSLVPNENEAEKLCGFPVDTPDGVFKALDMLREKGVKHPIITLGAKGAAYFDGYKNKIAEAYKVDVVDTTAAGDTFMGGLAAARIEGRNIDESVAFAQACAALSTCKYGAQTSIPSREEVDEIITANGE